MKAIIHIGMHKTGTSSVQASFHNRPPDGFGYLRYTGTNLNQWARVMFESDEIVTEIPTHASKTEQEVKALRQEVAQQSVDALASMNTESVILSAERFTYMAPDAVLSFRQWIDENFDDFEVYAYVRDPLPFIRSSFQQRAKALANLSTFSLDYPNYQSRFEKFETSFGREHVHYKLFRSKDLHSKNVVVDFSKWIGCDYADADSIVENEGISFEALALLVAVQSAQPPTKLPPRAMNTLVNVLQQHKGSKWAISENRASEILDQIGADLDWMDQRLPDPLVRGETGGGVEIDTYQDFIPVALQNFEVLRNQVFDAVRPVTNNFREMGAAMRLLKQL